MKYKLKLIYSNIVRKSKSQYKDKKIINSMNIAKQTWKILNESRKTSLDPEPNTLSIINNIVKDKETLRNIFNNFFMNIKKPVVNK